jgi:hypothetical protein
VVQIRRINISVFIFMNTEFGTKFIIFSWHNTCLNLGGDARLYIQVVSVEFFVDIILPSHYGSGVDSASNRNEYQEYFLGVNAAGA